MDSVVLFDTPKSHSSLLPLTYTRPVAELRVGINTIAAKWIRTYRQVSFLTAPYLGVKYLPAIEKSIYIYGGALPDEEFLKALKELTDKQVLVNEDGEVIAFRGQGVTYNTIEETVAGYEKIVVEVELVTDPWDIFAKNAAQIEYDFTCILKERKSVGVQDPHTVVYGKDNIFVEEGASIRAAIINAEKGPVYIGKNAQVHEGSIIAGAFALCEGAHVNMGAKIKGDSTVGPYSKVGGEVSNSVILGYTNKGHDGFLGNSVIGEWCNIGADSNTSNLKNNYAPVRLWNYEKGGFKNTGLQFCGLIMGDHSKCGINTMFNTGTVVGVNANIFGSGFPRNFVPSYSWGGANGFTTYQPKKAFQVAEVVMERRDKILTDIDKAILEYVFELSRDYRVWDK